MGRGRKGTKEAKNPVRRAGHHRRLLITSLVVAIVTRTASGYSFGQISHRFKAEQRAKTTCAVIDSPLLE